MLPEHLNRNATWKNSLYAARQASSDGYPNQA